MSLFTIDQEKCKRDGICVLECPMRIISMPEKDSFPVLVDNAESLCLDCGHCAAVCPYGALDLDSMPLETCLPVHLEQIPAAAQIKHFMLTRRSVRRFKKQTVSREILEDLIATARYAPTGSNQQKVHWTVVENPVQVRKLAGMVVDWSRSVQELIPDPVLVNRLKALIQLFEQGEDRILHGAPHLVVASAPADLISGPIDCAIALSHFELYAHANGLGSCWAGYFNRAAFSYLPLKEALGLPEGHQCFGALMLGYPQYGYERIPERHVPGVTWI